VAIAPGGTTTQVGDYIFAPEETDKINAKILNELGLEHHKLKLIPLFEWN